MPVPMAPPNSVKDVMALLGHHIDTIDQRNQCRLSGKALPNFTAPFTQLIAFILTLPFLDSGTFNSFGCQVNLSCELSECNTDLTDQQCNVLRPIIR